jgi:hypothetical protein
LCATWADYLPGVIPVNAVPYPQIAINVYNVGIIDRVANCGQVTSYVNIAF